ncbi:hypothetical protein LTR95_001814 [Oleoguttula sp. CCFEE 5521]
MDQRSLDDGLELMIEHLAPVLKSTKAIKDKLLTGPDKYSYALAGAEHVTLGRIRYAAIDTLLPDRTHGQRASQGANSGDDADAGEDESMHDSHADNGDEMIVENESASPSFQISEAFVSSSSTGVIETDLASVQQTISSRGITHGLPSLPPRVTELTAIVTGANGISGHYLLRVLGRDTKRWKKPTMFSSSLTFIQFRITIVTLGLLHKNPSTSTVHYFNILTALPIASITPKRILLQTGAKTYGVHLGLTKLPQEESDARVLLETSFYYAQEDALSAFCEEIDCASNVCITGPITGAVADAAMNYAYPLAIYAAVCAKPGEPMMFPGDETAWQSPQSTSYVLMNAYMEE